MEAYLKLGRRRQKFVDAIVEGKTGSDAYRAIIPKSKRPDVGASKLKAIPEIAAAIQERRAEAIEAAGVNLQRVLEELAHVAFFDPRKLLTPAGHILPTSEWPSEVAAAISGLDVEALFEGNGKDRVRVGDVVKYRAWPKVEALKLLMQHLGALTEKHELTGKDGAPLPSAPVYIIAKEEATQIAADLDAKV